MHAGLAESDRLILRPFVRKAVQREKEAPLPLNCLSNKRPVISACRTAKPCMHCASCWIDDDPHTLEYMGVILEPARCPWHTAPSCAAALKRIALTNKANAPYDICFIDWNMPDVNGFATAKEIRAQCPKMLITIISAYTLDNIQDKLQELVQMPIWPSLCCSLPSSICS